MSLVAYEIPLDWVPDPVYINAPFGVHYLAWQIGVNSNLKTGLWLIAPVISSPEPLEDLLPASYSTQSLDADTATYGQKRTVQSKDTIDVVQTDFLAQVDIIAAEVLAGHR